MVSCYSTTCLLYTAIVLFALLIITGKWRAVQFYCKYYAFLVSCALTGSTSLLALLLNPGDSGNFYYGKSVYRLFQLNRWFGIDIKVVNEHFIHETPTPYVIVANHQSSLDFLVMLHMGPDRTATVAKKELFYAPIFGFIIWLAGTIFIDRNKPSAIDAMKKAAMDVKRTNTNVWIFPEGTRTQIDDFLPFKKGAFHLAIQAQIPIIPVVIGNYRNVLDKENRIFGSGSIHVKVLEPIVTEGMTNEGVAELVGACRERMLEVFQKDSENRAEELKDLMPLRKVKEA